MLFSLTKSYRQHKFYSMEETRKIKMIKLMSVKCDSEKDLKDTEMLRLNHEDQVNNNNKLPNRKSMYPSPPDITSICGLCPI